MNGCRKHDRATVMSPVKVDVQVIGDKGAAVIGRTYSGTVESGDISTVSFSVPGTISEIKVQMGQKVSKGQLLARVKSESLVNAANISDAELEEARDAYRRLKKLHDAHALPDIKWVEVQAKLEQAENAAALARRAVGDASLYSPISGYVSEKLAEDGQTVIAAQPVLRIVGLEDMRISISVPEEEIAGFSDGLTGTVAFDGLDSMKITGKLIQKAVVADPFTRTYAVKFSIPNPGGRILPGMIGYVSVDKVDRSEIRDSVFVLPSQAVLLDSDNRQFVWIAKDGRAARRYVDSDELSDKGVIVRSGLSCGDSVIVAGMQKVGTGTRVSASR